MGALLPSVIYNVWDYGAKGDGVADDAWAIQAAVDAAVAGGGGIVFFPVGIFLVGSDIRVGSYVTVVGSGQFATQVRAVDGVWAFDFSDTVDSGVGRLSIHSSDNAAFQVGGGAFYLGGITTNFKASDVYTWLTNRSVYVDAGGQLTHAYFERCTWFYNREWQVQFTGDCQINSVEFNACRFEQNGGVGFGAFSASGVTSNPGGVRFIGTIIESQRSQYAVMTGDNLIYDFIGCHFENNGTGQANAADVLIGNGLGSVRFEECEFANPDPTATNFYNIERGFDSNVSIVAAQNRISGAAAEWQGFIKAPLTLAPVTTISNAYTNMAVGVDPLVGVVEPSRINEDFAVLGGESAGPIVTKTVTTDATPTNIYERAFLNTSGGTTYRSHLLVADVAVADAAGVEYATFSLQATVTGETGASITLQAQTATVTERSDAAITAVFAVSTDNDGTVRIVGTGKAGVTLTWVARIQRTSVLV